MSTASANRLATVSPEDGVREHEVRWSELTRLDAKRRVYGDDLLFCESYQDASDVLGERLGSALHQVAVVLIRPDALAAGRVGPTLDLLAQTGYRPVHAVRTSVGRLACRVLWRYQLNASTLDRLAIGDVLAGACDWVVALVRSEDAAAIPASVRLSASKGPAVAHRRKASDLRTQLGSPNPVVTFVHIPDEPADIVRDVGVLLDRPARLALYRSLANASAPDVGEQLRSLAWRIRRRTQPLDLNIAAVMARSLRAVEAPRPPAQRSFALLARKQLLAAREGAPLAWRTLVGNLERAAVALPPWDLVMLGGAFSTLMRPDKRKLIEGAAPQLWSQA